VLNPYDLAPILRRIVSMTTRASDIIFSPGFPPKVLADGQLAEVPIKDFRVLTPYQTEMMVLSLLKDKPIALRQFLETGATDTSYALEKVGRFRINIFRQRGSIATVMRVIPTDIPTFESLGLPKILERIIDMKNGVVLFTGPTGCGKSSSLAALIHMMATKYAYHIITIEDPIEFLYPRTRSMIHQRELGLDTDNFANALRTALRQAPQVILVGEMRDRDSMEIALEAAETGHLILSTLHTIDAAKSIERIIGTFPKDMANFIRNRFSQTFRFIVSQKLLPRLDGKGRVLAAEILHSNERTRTYVSKGLEKGGGSLHDAMEDSAHDGMQTFDMDLLRLVDENVISREVAIQNASNPNNLALKMGMLKERGPSRKKKKEKESVDNSQTLDQIPILGLDQQ